MKTLLCLILIAFSFTLTAAQLTIVTEDLPPLQIDTPNESASGAMVEVVNLLMKEAQLSAKIQFYPWARSYNIAQIQKNTLIFSIFRSKEREKKFQWIGEIYQMRSIFVALKIRNDIKINKFKDIKKYSIGSIRDSLRTNYLRKKGITTKNNLYVTSNYSTLWKILYSGRTDTVLTTSMVWQQSIKKSGLDPQKIKVLYQIPDISSKIYIAASLNTDKAVVIKLQKALKQIKNDGRYQQILTKWQL